MGYGDNYDNYKKYRNPTVLTLSEKTEDSLLMGVSTAVKMGAFHSQGVEKVTAYTSTGERVSERVSDSPTEGLLVQGKLLLDFLALKEIGKLYIGPLFTYTSYSNPDAPEKPSRKFEESGFRLGGTLGGSFFFGPYPIGLMGEMSYERGLSGFHKGEILSGTWGLNFRAEWLTFGPFVMVTVPTTGKLEVGEEFYTPELTYGINIQSPTLVF